MNVSCSQLSSRAEQPGGSVTPSDHLYSHHTVDTQSRYLDSHPANPWSCLQSPPSQNVLLPAAAWPLPPPPPAPAVPLLTVVTLTLTPALVAAVLAEAGEARHVTLNPAYSSRVESVWILMVRYRGEVLELLVKGPGMELPQNFSLTAPFIISTKSYAQPLVVFVFAAGSRSKLVKVRLIK